MKLKPKAMPKQKEDKDQEPEIPDVHPEGLRQTDDGTVLDSEDIAARILVHATDAKSLKKIIEEGQLASGITRHKQGRTQNHLVDFTDFVRSNKLRDFPPNQLRPECSHITIFISHHKQPLPGYSHTTGRTWVTEDAAPVDDMLTHTNPENPEEILMEEQSLLHVANAAQANRTI